MSHPSADTALAHESFLIALDQTIDESNDVDVKHLGNLLKELYELTATDPRVRVWLDEWCLGVLQRGDAA